MLSTLAIENAEKNAKETKIIYKPHNLEITTINFLSSSFPMSVYDCQWYIAVNIAVFQSISFHGHFALSLKIF